jgi:hypothetical protein
MSRRANLKPVYATIRVTGLLFECRHEQWLHERGANAVGRSGYKLSHKPDVAAKARDFRPASFAAR